MVLLSRNSRVDAYRNEQLLGLFYLNSGSQFIDTSSFPPGSYSVALKFTKITNSPAPSLCRLPKPAV